MPNINVLNDIIYPEDLTFISLNEVQYELVRGFSCGNPTIDNYLKVDYKARKDHSLGLASTTAVYYKNNVVAFYTACCTQIEIGKIEADQYGIPSLNVPAIEVKFLAVHREYQDRGIGKLVLQTLISDVYAFSVRFACRYIFLWSVPEEKALAFYTKRFFEDTGGTNMQGLHLMMYRIPEEEEEEEY